MASINRDNRTPREGDITSDVKPAESFTQISPTKKYKEDSLLPLLAYAALNETQNHNASILTRESLGRYISENYVVRDNASVTIDGHSITADNFYTSSPTSGGASSNFGSIFRGPNIDMDDFFPRAGKGSNVAIDGSFQQAFGIVVASEGGFSNHKADTGGATIFGIASRHNPTEYRQIMNHLNSGDKQSAMDLTMRVYKEKYWDAAGISKIQDADARLIAFDAAINHGTGYARRMIRNTGEDADAMLRYRANTYIQIVANNPSQGEFLNGWRNRLSHLNDLTSGPSAPMLRVADAPSESNSSRPTASASREVASTPLSQEVLSRTFGNAGNEIRVPSLTERVSNGAQSLIDTGRRFIAGFDFTP